MANCEFSPGRWLMDHPFGAERLSIRNVFKCPAVEIVERCAAVEGVELFQRGVDGDRRIIRLREAVQCQQHLLAARKALWIATKHIGKPLRREPCPGFCSPAAIERDLVGHRAGQARQRGLRVRSDEEGLAGVVAGSQGRMQRGAAPGKIRAGDEFTTPHKSIPQRPEQLRQQQPPSR